VAFGRISGLSVVIWEGGGSMVAVSLVLWVSGIVHLGMIYGFCLSLVASVLNESSPCPRGAGFLSRAAFASFSAAFGSRILARSLRTPALCLFCAANSSASADCFFSELLQGVRDLSLQKGASCLCPLRVPA